jgi:hypothetical protein
MTEKGGFVNRMPRRWVMARSPRPPQTPPMDDGLRPEPNDYRVPRRAEPGA